MISKKLHKKTRWYQNTQNVMLISNPLENKQKNEKSYQRKSDGNMQFSA
jgi:hypothetical protein